MIAAARAGLPVAAGLAAVPAVAVALMAAALVAQPPELSSEAQADIPPEYLALYQAAAKQERLGQDGWSFLAAVGKVECDHGRSTAVGCHRGEANVAGARGPAQFLPSTWSRYGVDADGDGTRDIYGPADAVFGMANYLHASGAPGNWETALFAYNHDREYVDRVVEWARRYRAEATESYIAPATEKWLSDLPGAPGTRCDSRIVADVVALEHAYGLRITACFGGAPHAIDGEHPLGLAIDAVPADLNWSRTRQLAQDYGWSPACAAQGCASRGPFRVILYNGFPGHGDPAHTATPHIHLSWNHAPAAPFTRAAWVRTLLRPRLQGDPRCPNSSSRPRPQGAGGGCSG